MKEKGTILKQIDGDLYLCQMGSGRRYDIEIIGYSGGETNRPFILHRFHPEHGEVIEIEDLGLLSVIVQAEW